MCVYLCALRLVCVVLIIADAFFIARGFPLSWWPWYPLVRCVSLAYTFILFLLFYMISVWASLYITRSCLGVIEGVLISNFYLLLTYVPVGLLSRIFILLLLSCLNFGYCVAGGLSATRLSERLLHYGQSYAGVSRYPPDRLPHIRDNTRMFLLSGLIFYLWTLLMWSSWWIWLNVEFSSTFYLVCLLCDSHIFVRF